jgi:KipI family sensor histidine kinase inhibitor
MLHQRGAWPRYFLLPAGSASIFEMRLKPVFFDCAESALLVDFGRDRENGLALSILRMSERLEASMLPGFKESIPALSSLTLLYDPMALSRQRLIQEIERVCETSDLALDSGRTWRIPVAYGGDFGPDLEDVSRAAGMSEDEAAALHAGETYHVYMLGFLPGFAYLGDVPEKLRLPRRATPRTQVPAGSVAIAAEMTAIYPFESPGGWRLIGRTPFPLWDMAREEEPRLRPGDNVRFYPAGAAEIEAFARRIAEGWAPAPLEAP